MSGDAARTAVTAELDARVPDRVCCRRESARTGAALRAAESALQNTQSELVSVKRRLRQYAQTLDAVSVHAKDEIGVALQARNSALSAAASTAAERDALGQKSTGLSDALSSARAEHADLKRRHDLVNTALTTSVEEVTRLRRDFERAKRAANDASAKAAGLARERAQAQADLSETRLARRAAADERDALTDDLQEANVELAATRRELALVRHELATRAPPEISQNVRRDIAEGAAAAVERRTLGMIRAVAKHYLDFGLDRPEPVQVQGVPGDETDDEISEHESDDGLAERIITTSPLPDVNARAFDRSTVFVPTSAPVEDAEGTPVDDPMGELPEADALLEQHMASIKKITVDADATSPPALAADGLAPDTAIIGEEPALAADAPEMIVRSLGIVPEGKKADLESPAPYGNKRFSLVSQHEDGEGTPVEEEEEEAVPAAEQVVYEDTPAEPQVVYEQQPTEEVVYEEQPAEEVVYEEQPAEVVYEEQPAEEIIEEQQPAEVVNEDTPAEQQEQEVVYAETPAEVPPEEEVHVEERAADLPTEQPVEPEVEEASAEQPSLPADEVDGEEVLTEVVEGEVAPLPANGNQAVEEVDPVAPVAAAAPVAPVAPEPPKQEPSAVESGKPVEQTVA